MDLTFTVIKNKTKKGLYASLLTLKTIFTDSISYAKQRLLFVYYTSIL